MRVGTTAAPDTGPETTSVASVASVGILVPSLPGPGGPALFGVSLARALAHRGVNVQTVSIVGSALVDGRAEGEPASEGSPSSADSVGALNGCDIAFVQHVTASSVTDDGDGVVEVLKRLTVPAIVIAYGGAKEPTDRQLSVMREIAAEVDCIVVMSEAARAEIGRVYGIDVAKVAVIPHGAARPNAPTPSAPGSRPMLLTWGLLQPGKGIERMIGAMCSLHRGGIRPRPRYVVAGTTHPDELAANGERYRNACMTEAWRAGVAPSVVFDAAFRSDCELMDLVQSAAAVVLPYDSTVQATSRVLIESIAAGRPVVATAFPHAVEQLSSGAGIVVDHDNPDALVDALRMVLSEPDVATNMATESTRLAPRFGWSAIAGAYLELVARLLADRRGAT